MVIINETMVPRVVNEETGDHLLEREIKEANLPFSTVTRYPIYNVRIRIQPPPLTQLLVIVQCGFTNAFMHEEFVQEHLCLTV